MQSNNDEMIIKEITFLEDLINKFTQFEAYSLPELLKLISISCAF